MLNLTCIITQRQLYFKENVFYKLCQDGFAECVNSVIEHNIKITSKINFKQRFPVLYQILYSWHFHEN